MSHCRIKNATLPPFRPNLPRICHCCKHLQPCLILRAISDGHKILTVGLGRCAQARGEPFRVWMLLPRRNRHFRHFNDMEMVSGMDPLGFGPSSSALYSHGNAQMNGGGVSHPVRAKRGKGGFL